MKWIAYITDVTSSGEFAYWMMSNTKKEIYEHINKLKHKRGLKRVKRPVIQQLNGDLREQQGVSADG